MTFPAREQFDRESPDPRARLYAHCRKVLSFVEPRELKAAAVWHETHIERAKISRLLTWLVDGGFLHEHARKTTKHPRRFTLNLETNRAEKKHGRHLTHSHAA